MTDKMRDTHQIVLPITTGHWATLNAQLPMTESEWEQIIHLLQVMKPALVKPAPQPQPQAGEETHDDQ